MRRRVIALAVVLGLGVAPLSSQVTVTRGSGTISTVINEFITNVFNNGQGSQLLTGGDVAWSSGLTFRVSAATYLIENVEYSSAEQTVTLDAADGTNPRIDVIALDNTGTVVKVTGTAAATPTKPSIDPATQLELTFATVAAGASTPTVTNTTVYTENAGHAAEWDCTDSGASIVCNSTNNPRTDTTDIEGTSVPAGDYAQLQIGGGGTFDVNSVDRLIFHIRSKATWGSNRGLRVQLLTSGVLKGTQITLRHGSFGFDSTITNAYQQVVLTPTDFSIPQGTLINQIRFVKFGSGTDVGFYIDDVVWQDGGTGGQGGDFLTQTQADARYVLLNDHAEVNEGNSGAAKTINWNARYVARRRITLTDNVTFTFSNPVEGANYSIILVQDGTGSRTVTWPAAVEWGGGVAPTLTTTASAADVCTFLYTGAGSGKYLAACNLNHTF